MCVRESMCIFHFLPKRQSKSNWNKSWVGHVSMLPDTFGHICLSFYLNIEHLLSTMTSTGGKIVCCILATVVEPDFQTMQIKTTNYFVPMTEPHNLGNTTILYQLMTKSPASKRNKHGWHEHVAVEHRLRIM